MKNGEAVKQLTKEFISTIKAANNFDELKPYAEQFKSASKELEQTIMHLLQFAMSGDHERYISDASIFMEMMSNVVIAWQWLKMATVAKQSIASGNATYDVTFYEKKVLTMKYFFKYELPKILASKETLMSNDCLTVVEKSEKAFI